jgi:hypothetical protein
MPPPGRRWLGQDAVQPLGIIDCVRKVAANPHNKRMPFLEPHLVRDQWMESAESMAQDRQLGEPNPEISPPTT